MRVDNPARLELSIQLNDETDEVHAFRTMPLREYTLWRESSDELVLSTKGDDSPFDEYIRRNSFYVATYRKMRTSLKLFNQHARDGCKDSWLRYRSLKWDGTMMCFQDKWYGTKYYVCWRQRLYSHVLHQII